MIKYSIVIPHYNDKENLINLLRSISFNKSIEIIVIDDNSNLSLSDLSEIQKYSSSLIINSGCKGAGSCRNLGLNAASGKWIIFADSDDLFEKDFISIIEKEISQDFNDDVDVFYFNPVSRKIKDGSLGTRHGFYRNLIYDYFENGSDYIRYKFHVPWSKVIRREFLLKNNILFDEVIASNDIIFSLKLGINAVVIKCSKNTFYCVTEREGSLTSSPNFERMQSRLYAMIRYNDYLYMHNKKNMQMPIVVVVRSFAKYMNFEILLKLAFGFFKGKYKLFPGGCYFDIKRLES
ncbi:glycosyltransferase family 2 protein [Vibrio alginolyticus]|uniref:glycosyltransferase family 2 protein n=1 Tax=Vibrio alginolyticus TaxID=663 RepID=UPI001C92F9B6|nr:glycosyltransferase family 2 protein [Vibrio alginolyticus]MBY4648155.1 glycosyltransferase [Vibrio alginolyticus]